MKRLLIILLLFSVISVNACFSQFKKQLDSFTLVAKSSLSDSDKVVALGQLANLYYTYKLNHQGDSVLKEQLLIAELSDNNNLIILALFGDALTNISSNASIESFDRVVQFLQKGIDYAKNQNQYEYLAIGYTRMSNILKKRGQNDKALYEATQAVQLIPNIISDSIKAVIYIELGNAYMARSEAVAAVRNYNNAFDIALKIKSVPLQSEIYHCFSEMYFVFLKNKDIAKDFLKKSLKLNKEHQFMKGQVRDYLDLSRVTDEKYYLNMALKLADSLHFFKYLLEAKILRFYYYFVVDKDTGKALYYLENEPDIKQTFINEGYGNYYLVIGHIYYYANQFDSAMVYYKLAEKEFVSKFDDKRSKGLFKYIGDCYKDLHELPNAIEYYLKALNLSKKTNDASSIASVSNTLSALYEQQGDYQQAFLFAKQAKQYSDSLDNLSKARDIALLDVERENRRHENDLRLLAQKEENKRNAQYMAITIAILIIFAGMLVLGMFPISKLTIKLLGYIFFISLFEFIVLVIDTFLHKITHGEPLKIWLIKIALIAMLVPIQHGLEHKLIKFLESRKLLEARTKFNFRKLRERLKKPAPMGEAGFEEGTAVL